jgi:hypothetical protein
MTYIYINNKGERVELDFPLGKAPEQTKFDNQIYSRDRASEFACQQFILKGGDWPSQTMKRKEQMTRNNTAAGNRTNKTWGKPKRVVPNYKGEVTDSWEDASSLAKKAGS